MNDLVGTEFAGFRITAPLGEGMSAVVYRGENVLRPDIVRAIKVIRRELSAKPEFLRRFLEEAGALDQMQDPNRVRSHGLRQADGRLAMELGLRDAETFDGCVGRRGGVPATGELAATAVWALRRLLVRAA